jgi:hypothetical protein
MLSRAACCACAAWSLAVKFSKIKSVADSMRQFLGADNFAIAWGKVSINQGCAGMDGETLA